MIQPLTFARVRMPVLAIGALGLLTAAGVAVPRLTATPPAQLMVRQATLPAQRVLSVPAVVESTTSTDRKQCDAGAYVSGDLVGDASPATIYAALCGTR
jgi:hypothetical protein